MSAKENTRARRRPWRIGLWVLACLAGAILGLRLFVHGDRLGGIVARRINAEIRGRVEIGSVEWSIVDLPGALFGADLPLTVRGVRVFAAPVDGAERGRQVIDVPYGTLTIDGYAALLGRHDIVLDRIVIPEGTAVIEQIRKVDPAHQYDNYAISLIDAFNPRRRDRFRAGMVARTSRIFDLKHYSLEGVRLEFDYPGWSAIVEGARGEGSLTYDGRDPFAGKLFYSLRPSAPSGALILRPEDGLPVRLELRGIEVPVLRQLALGWPDETVPRALEYQASATTVEGARLGVDGKMFPSYTDIFGSEHDLTLSVSQGGRLARRLSGLLPGGAVVAGDELALRLRLVGPDVAPRYDLQLSGIELTVPSRPRPLAVAIDRLSATWNSAISAGAIEDTVARAAGGEVELSATFSRKPDAVDLKLDVRRPMDLSPYLPPRVVRALGGGQLAGRLHAFATDEVQRLDRLDLTLGRAHLTGGLTRSGGWRWLGMRVGAGVVRPLGLEIAVGGTRARRITGALDSRTGHLALDLLVESTDVHRWLRALGQPPLARAASGRIRLGGSLDDLSARAELSASGVPVIDRLDTELAYRGGVLDIGHARATALGGQLVGSGQLTLGEIVRLSEVELDGTHILLSRLPVIGHLLGGTVDIEAQASGTARRPSVQATAAIRDLAIAGEPYDDTTVVARRDADGKVAVSATLNRRAGGELALDASLTGGRTLGGTVEVRRLPIEAMAALGGAPPNVVGGQLDASLTLAGTSAAPLAEGKIAVTRGWFREAFLGNAEITLERAGDGALRVEGRLFQGQVAIEGTIATAPPFAADLALDLNRVELDLIAPELARRHGVRAWLSGQVHYRGDLSLARAGRAELTARLSEAVVVLDAGALGQATGQLRLANRTPIELALRDGVLTLEREVVLHGPTGDFALSGSASAAALDLKARGRVSMGLLQPYLKDHFDRVSGEIAVELAVRGTLAAPHLAGVAEVDQVALQPTGQDTIVRVPAGKLELDGDQLSLTGLSMVVSDEFSEETSELSIAGGIRLKDLEPAMWAVRIDGQLDGKMLLVLFPQLFSSGYGSADLSIALLGQGAQPDIDGTLEFSSATPLTVVPRGARREIALTDGFVKFTDQLVEISAVRGSVDDEGKIERIEGEISLEDWRFVDVDVAIDAGGLPLRIPQQLELNVNLRDVRFIGGEGGLSISGTLEVIDGRYVRRFNLFDDAIKPQRTSAPSVPFWESNPLLAAARLDLKVVSQAFFVRNNIADIAMSGQVTIVGTPRAPRFDGVIHVDDGTFKFQGIRPTFERASGDLRFEPLRVFPSRTPTLNLRAESEYTDTTGQTHLIHMSLRGSLSNLEWDLRTESGLNRAQTLQLLLAGRTPEEVRRALGDTSVGGAGKFADAAAAGGSGFILADQLIKDLSGDVFSLLVGDSLRNVTGLDVVRLQLGTNAVGLTVEEKLFSNLRVIGRGEKSLLGSFFDLTSIYRLTDALSLDAKYQRKNYNEETIEDEQNVRFQSTWRWVLLP